jgi:RNA polymerase sigma-70 factor (ECF subfamily)
VAAKQFAAFCFIFKFGIFPNILNSITNHTQDLNETELINKLIAREEDAFRQLIDLYGDRVHNTVLSIIQSKEDAEDLTQEVFIEVYNSIGKFKGESQVYTWIYRIATTKCFDLLRKRKAKKRFAFVTSIFSNAGEELEISDFNHPGIITENNERAQILFAAINKLTDNQRVAFTLSQIENLSYKEIAEIMRLSVSSVESLIFRAKSTLRKILQDYYNSS